MSTPLRVLLVEDSADDAALIVRHLQHGGYDVAFERVDSREGMSRAIERQSWDLVICDYSMPHFSGTEALKLVRERGSDAPFIFVSGTIGEETAVSALKLGAQDYVMKGNLTRLLPAVERELREAEERRERARLQQRLKQLERFEAIGKLAGGLAPNLRVIRADPTQIDQILMNLCLNSRDAMPHGGRLVIQTQDAEIGEAFCKTHPDAVAGEYVLLTVSDTGAGMDKETLDHIFEPFFTTKELGKGTGLGLATVYGIVKQHEGFIHVDTEPGRGTAFHLYFPASKGEIEKRDSRPVSNISRGTETILVADDNEGIRDIAQEFLGACGYTVVPAENGEEAVRLFSENTRVALVILDVSMPLLSGPEAYRRMCEIRPGLPVIFTTGHTAESPLLNLSLQAGAVLLEKPYAPQELSRIVRRSLDFKPRSS